jgi:hypothetical protein
MAGIGWLAAVAYASMDLMDSPDDEEGSIAYLFECVFKKKIVIKYKCNF